MGKKSNVLQKRIAKLRGFLNLAYSFFCCRFTAFNEKRLFRHGQKLGVDRLHVGCGLGFLPGWLNISFELREEYGKIRRREGALWLNYDLRRPWPFAEGSIQFIAGSHFIEHLDLNAGLLFFKEAYRVMKKGGTIRMSCPDLQIYVTHYINNDKDFFGCSFIREACTFKNAVTPGEIFIAKAYDSGGAHKWFYDFESLKHVLESAGFRDVAKVTLRSGRVPDIEKIELPERDMETLYVEAVK